MTNKFTEVLWGIAIADAIGNPLEFLGSVKESDFNAAINSPLHISDDTQMTLFCADALCQVGLEDDLAGALIAGYDRWYGTQLNDVFDRRTGLLAFKSLYRCEAPGRTCLTSLNSLRQGVAVSNRSKGSGTVMRCVPIPFWGRALGLSAEQIFHSAEVDARITHHHPLAADSSIALVALHLNLAEGFEFVSAVEETVRQLQGRVSSVLLEQMSAVCTTGGFAAFNQRMQGWVAEEALLLAVGSVAHSTDYLDAVSKAVMRNGDSDTVGGIAGGLAAASGMSPPPGLQEKIVASDAIEYLADRCALWP